MTKSDTVSADALTDHLYILSANEEAMEEAIERFDGSSAGEALKCVLHAQKQIRALLLTPVEQPAAALIVSLPCPVALDRTHSNDAYVTLGFDDPAACDAFLKAARALWESRAPSLTNERAEFDGDSEETRAAFRAYDQKERVSSRTSWQIWRDACAWQARAACATEKVAADETPTPLDIETVRVIRSFVDRPGETYHGFIQRRLGIGFGRALRRAIEESGLAATCPSVEG